MLIVNEPPPEGCAGAWACVLELSSFPPPPQPANANETAAAPKVIRAVLEILICILPLIHVYGLTDEVLLPWWTVSSARSPGSVPVESTEA